MFGAENVDFAITFRSSPWIAHPILLKGEVNLRMMGIDTDAEVPRIGPSRLFGRGRFVTQLKALDDQLSALPPKNEVRVLLLHHSVQNQHYKLGIHPKSRAALETFITQHEISLLLTGHTHDAKGQMTEYRNSGSAWILLEARCGTTTQRDQMPVGWKPRFPALSPNTLLVHRIKENAAKEIVWTTTLYERTSKGFGDRGRLGETRVWPRPR
jgi:hypothetical protein